MLMKRRWVVFVIAIFVTVLAAIWTSCSISVKKAYAIDISSSMIGNYDFATENYALDSTALNKTVLQGYNNASLYKYNNPAAGTDPSAYHWEQRVAPGGGFKLKMNASEIASGTYSIGMRFSLEITSRTHPDFPNYSGYVKVLDFKEQTKDAGLYFRKNTITFFHTTTSENVGNFLANNNEIVDLIMTRNGSTKVFTVYALGLGGTAAQVMQFIDSDDTAVPLNGTFDLFHNDDPAVTGSVDTEYSPSGNIYSLKVWNRELSQSEIQNSMIPTISSGNVSNIAQNYSFTGSPIKPEPIVTVGGKILTKDVDYRLSYSSTQVGIGKVKITITGIGNYNGTANKEFTILPKNISNSDVTMSTLANMTYTGTALTPLPILKFSGKTLVKGTDYDLQYTNNVNAGRVTVTAVGKGNYSGSKSVTFMILSKNISNSDVTMSTLANMTYTGTVLTPLPTLKFSGKTLVKGTDYDLQYSDNVNAGKATVTAVGKGNYSGSKSVTFMILSKNISNSDVTMSTLANMTYTGTALTPLPTLKFSGKTLVKGTDYDLQYSANANAGKATVTAVGKGNYIGSKSVNFEIAKANQNFIINAIGNPECFSETMLSHTATSSKGIFTWKSSDTSIVSVETNGKLIAKNKVGSAVITLSNPGDSNYNSRQVTLTVQTTLTNGFYIGNLAGTHTVYRTLKEAIAASSDHGTVFVKGNPTVGAVIEISAKSVAVKGHDPSATLLRASNVTGNIFNIKSDAELLLENITLDGKNVLGDSLIETQGLLVIGGGAVLKNANAMDDGGAIYVGIGGKLRVEAGSSFVGNSAQNGGAIYLSDDAGNVAINGGSMSNNSASALGDAVYMNNHGLTLNGGAATAGITDSIGIEGSAEITVTGEIQHKVSVEFKDPASQLSETKSYVISRENTGAALKEHFRVVNSGYTFDGEMVGNALVLQESRNEVARFYANGEWHTFTNFQAAINRAVELNVQHILLVQYQNDKEQTFNAEIELNETLKIPKNANFTFGSVLKHTDSSGASYQYETPTIPTVLKRGESLKGEMILVQKGAAVTFGGATVDINNEGTKSLAAVTLDGGANFGGNYGAPQVSDDGKGGAGTAVTGNQGIMAHAPIIVNRGTLKMNIGTTIQNNDNNYAKPGEGFGSQNYGGGVRNEGSGEFQMDGGEIKNCYSREGGAIININKPQTPAYDDAANPKVTISGGSIKNNASQMKGAAIQTIYGGAVTTISGGAVESNSSLNDLGILSVEEGGKLAVKGGVIGTNSQAADKNVIYIYNKYSAADFSSASTKPFIEGKNAAILEISGSPQVTGKVHLDNSCFAHDPVSGKPSNNRFHPIINMKGYVGNTIAVELDKDHSFGKIAMAGSSDKINVAEFPTAICDMSAGYLISNKIGESDYDILYGGYNLTVTQSESGKVKIKGECDTSIVQITFAIDNVNYQFSVVDGTVDAEIVLSEKTKYNVKVTASYRGATAESKEFEGAIHMVQFDKTSGRIAAPIGTKYVANDANHTEKELCDGTLPNNIAIDEQGNATFIVNNEERVIHIGTRAEAVDVEEPNVTDRVGGDVTDLANDTMAIKGKKDYEYNLLDKDGKLVSSDWKSVANDGDEIIFSGLAEHSQYTVVVRAPATADKLPSIYTPIPDCVYQTLSAQEAANKKEFEDAYQSIENKLPATAETKATTDEIQAVLDAYGDLTDEVKALPFVKNDKENLDKAYSRAEAKAWQDANADIIAKDLSQVSAEDVSAIENAISSHTRLVTMDDAKELVADDYAAIKQKAEKVFRDEIDAKVSNLSDQMRPEDSDEAKRIITDGMIAIGSVTYDHSKTLSVQEIAIDEMLATVLEDLALQRAKDDAKNGIIKRHDVLITEATHRGYTGTEDLTAAKDAACADIDRAETADEIIERKEDGFTTLDKEFAVLDIKNYIKQDDSDQAKKAATDGETVIDALVRPVSQQVLDDIIADVKAAVDAERFLDAHDVMRKDFAEIDATDKAELEKALEELQNLTDEKTRAKLDEAAVDSGYKDCEDLIGDAVKKAEYEAKKKQTIEKVEALVSEHDGDRVKEKLKEEIQSIQDYFNYTPQSEGNRDNYFEQKVRELDEAFEDSKIVINHAQAQQRTEDQLQSEAEIRIESGRYNQAQKEEIQRIMNDAIVQIDAVAAGLTNEEIIAAKEELDNIFNKTKEKLEEVPVVSVTNGMLVPDAVSDRDEYPDEHNAEELWGIVTNETGMNSAINLVIEKTATNAIEQIKNAVKNGKLSAAAGSQLTSDVLAGLIKGKEIKSSLEIYLKKGEVRITEFDGKYRIMILLTPEMRNMVGLQVVYVENDGNVQVFETRIEDGKYLVFTTTHFSEFFILGEPILNLWWLIITLTVVLTGEIFGIGIVLKRRKKQTDVKDAVQNCALMSCALPTIVIPSPAILVCSILGGLVVAAAAVLITAVAVKKKRLPTDTQSCANGNSENLVEKTATVCADGMDSAALTDCVATAALAADSYQVQPINSADGDSGPTVTSVANVAAMPIGLQASGEDTHQGSVKRSMGSAQTSLLIQYRKSFTAHLIQSGERQKQYYSQLKNELLSYTGVKCRSSWRGETFRIGRKAIACIRFRGKTLGLYLVLSAADYAGTKYLVEEVGGSSANAKLRSLYRIKNDLRLNYARDLIADACTELVRETIKTVDYAAMVPYETTEALINKKLIKVMAQRKPERKEYQLQREVSVFQAAALMKDKEAAMLVECSGRNSDRAKTGIVNVDMLSRYFLDGETVTLSDMKNRIPGFSRKTTYVKVLARGVLDKALIVHADSFSLDAVKMIVLTGGKVMKNGTR